MTDWITAVDAAEASASTLADTAISDNAHAKFSTQNRHIDHIIQKVVLAAEGTTCVKHNTK